MEKRTANPILTFLGTYIFAFIFYLIWTFKYLNYFQTAHPQYKHKIKRILFFIEINIGFILMFGIIYFFNKSDSLSRVTKLLPFLYDSANIITLIIAIMFSNIISSIYSEEGYPTKYFIVFKIFCAIGIFLIGLIPFQSFEFQIMLFTIGNGLVAVFVTFLQLKLNQFYTNEKFLYLF